MSLRDDSVFLCLLLRHKPEVLHLDMDKGGWISIEQLIANSNGRITLEKLKQIIKEERSRKNKDNKDRYAITGDFEKIRANQGHSIKGLDLGLVSTKPPEELYHGTAKHNLESIEKIGIVCNNPEYSARVDVHLSTSVDTALSVGARHVNNSSGDYSLVLIVRSGDMYRDGFTFKCSDNGVWLCGDVPPSYIK